MDEETRQNGNVLGNPMFLVSNKVTYPDETAQLIFRALQIRQRQWR